MNISRYFKLDALSLFIVIAFPAAIRASTPAECASEPSIHTLFRRNGNNASFPTVGSPTWLAAYPTGTPDTTKTPKAWTDAFNSAVQAGKIPNIPPAPLVKGVPVYPPHVNPNDNSVCSAAAGCNAMGDIVNSPDGTIGIGFDDGPVPWDNSSSNLYAFLKANNQTATHFMIGIAILQAPLVFLDAFNNGGDIAVHTYTHPFMTSLTNEAVVAELGWTMQIIYDSTGGLVPKFWRPPHGDLDNRIRAIALEVFGLTTILWNHDTEDWQMSENTVTPKEVAANLSQWISGPKSPGLIILEHELTDATVQAFIDAYPTMAKHDWNTTSIARMSPSALDNVTGPVYWNSEKSVSSFETLFPIAQALANTSNTSNTSATSASTVQAPANSSVPATSQKTSHASNTLSLYGLLLFVVLWSVQWTCLLQFGR